MRLTHGQRLKFIDFFHLTFFQRHKPCFVSWLSNLVCWANVLAQEGFKDSPNFITSRRKPPRGIPVHGTAFIAGVHVFYLLDHNLIFRHIMSMSVVKGAVLVLFAAVAFLSGVNFLHLALCSSLNFLSASDRGGQVGFLFLLSLGAFCSVNSHLSQNSTNLVKVSSVGSNPCLTMSFF